MKLKLIVVGKTIAAYLREGEAEYDKRIRRYRPFEMTVVPEPKNATKLPVAQLKLAEGELLLKQFDKTDFVLLLDENGKALRSVEFAAYLDQLEVAGTRRLVLVVGGPYGFSEAIYKRANGKLSLSKMTFSHQMVRLFAMEQLYRALSIRKGDPYHHE